MKWDRESPPQVQRANAREPRHRSLQRKDNQQWCRGKKGVEHSPAVTVAERGGYGCQQAGWTSGPCWLCCHLITCTTCGKHMGHPEVCPDEPDNWAAQRFFHW